jgi:hypothetical protein
MSVVSKGFSSRCVGPVAVLLSAPPKLPPGEWNAAVGEVDTLRWRETEVASLRGISCASAMLACDAAGSMGVSGREKKKKGGGWKGLISRHLPREARPSWNFPAGQP